VVFREPIIKKYIRKAKLIVIKSPAPPTGGSGVFYACAYKPNSVSLRTIVIYLQRLLLSESSGTTHAVNTCTTSCVTALHSSKDLAVSFLRFRRTTPKGVLSLSALAFLFAPLGFPQTGITRYPAPRLGAGVFGLSSPCVYTQRATIQHKLQRIYNTNYFLSIT